MLKVQIPTISRIPRSAVESNLNQKKSVLSHSHDSHHYNIFNCLQFISCLFFSEKIFLFCSISHVSTFLLLIFTIIRKVY